MNEVLISKTIAEIASISHKLPGVIIIHRMPRFSLEYMSPYGLSQLGISLETFLNYTVKEYTEKHFNLDDANSYEPKLRKMIEENSDENITFFQQVKINGNEEWVWHMSIMKILLRDEKGLPLLVINQAFKLDQMQHITSKVERILTENAFRKKNNHLFSLLTKQERIVLKLLALGKSSKETATELFVALGTIETHRKNIRRKLNVNGYYELCRFAQAFDQI